MAETETTEAPATEAAQDTAEPTDQGEGIKIDSDVFHPLAVLFPPMTDVQWTDFLNDIRDNGQQEPVIMLGDKVLEGRHRYMAGLTLGRPVNSIQFDDLKTGLTPLKYVLSKNMARRHMTDDQRAMVASETLPMLREEAKERQRKAAEATNKKRAKAPATEVGGDTSDQIPSDALPLGTDEAMADLEAGHEEAQAIAQGLAVEQAAEQAAVSPYAVNQAAKIAKNDPKVAAKVKSGEMSLKEAARQVGANKPAKPKKEAQAFEYPEDGMTPEEFLESLPVRKLIDKKDLVIFDAEALAYKRMVADLADLTRTGKNNLGLNRPTRGAFYDAVYPVLMMPHPRDWQAAPGQRGGSLIPLGGDTTKGKGKADNGPQSAQDGPRTAKARQVPVPALADTQAAGKAAAKGAKKKTIAQVVAEQEQAEEAERASAPEPDPDFEVDEVPEVLPEDAPVETSEPSEEDQDDSDPFADI